MYSTKSHNNFWLDKEGQAIKKYVKVPVHMLSCRRINLESASTELIDVLLKTREPAEFNPDDAVIPFNYHDNVVELYSEKDVTFFERYNKALIDDGKLVVFEENIDYAYVNGTLAEQPKEHDLLFSGNLSNVKRG